MHVHPPLSLSDIEHRLRHGTLSDSETAELHRIAAGFGAAKARPLLTAADALLDDRKFGAADRNRIGAVKLLVALLPVSLLVVEKWMFRTSDPYSGEVQFTFCCFLSDIFSFTPPDPATADAVLTMATRYLDGVPSDDAHNAFMAADMLGDHWTGDAGVAALVELARDSRNPVGRKAALGALRTAREHGNIPTRLLPAIAQL